MKFKVFIIQSAMDICINLFNQYSEIRTRLTDCMVERLMADRPIACLLSGGIDSSLVSAIAVKETRKLGISSAPRTFCIGMGGSTDVEFAAKVAAHIGSVHSVVNFTPEEGLAAIPEVIFAIESYDITTVRASVGQFLVSKFIAKNTDIKVVLIGDGSDEVTEGYLYFHNTPSASQGHAEAVRLIKEIHLYDGLRADRAISYHGLEARVPYLDKKLVDFYLSLPAELRCPRESPKLGIADRKVEKALLREAFADTDLLPECVLKRTKEALSDGISSLRRSWYETVQEHVAHVIPDAEWDAYRADAAHSAERALHAHNEPPSREALFYRFSFSFSFSFYYLLLSFFFFLFSFFFFLYYLLLSFSIFHLPSFNSVFTINYAPTTITTCLLDQLFSKLWYSSPQ